MKNFPIKLCISLFTFVTWTSVIVGMDQNKNPNFYKIPREIYKRTGRKDGFKFYATHQFKKAPLVVNLTPEQRLAAQLQNLPMYDRLTTADGLMNLANSNPAPKQNDKK